MINMQKRNYSGFQVSVPGALRIKNGTAIFDFFGRRRSAVSKAKQHIFACSVNRTGYAVDRRNSSDVVLGTLSLPEHEPEHYGLSSRDDVHFYELLPTHAFWFYWQRNQGQLASAGFTVRRFQNGGMKAFLFHQSDNLTTTYHQFEVTQ